MIMWIRSVCLSSLECLGFYVNTWKVFLLYRRPGLLLFSLGIYNFFWFNFDEILPYVQVNC